MENTRAHVLVEGYVQGVFFRAFTRDNALHLGVKGWVKNLPDRRVEAVFEGPADKVAEMVRLCEVGPPGARVVNVNVSWQPYTGEFDIFSIRRSW